LAPSLVKIDCEGYEPFILKGCRQLLQLRRAAFMVECNDSALLAATRIAMSFSVLFGNMIMLCFTWPVLNLIILLESAVMKRFRPRSLILQRFLTTLPLLKNGTS
jgi:hypothetical protein